MKILVVLNDVADPIGALGPPLLDAGFELATWRPADPPPEPTEFAGVIALGGPANPDEDHAYGWLRVERDLLRRAVAARLPVIGVCLGAQLLAQALGGRAYRMPRPRIGWSTPAAGPATARDPLAPAWDSLERALEWHAYGFTLPPGGELLVGTPDAVQAFRAGPCAWGFQYHLEADAAILAGWIRGGREKLAAAGVDPVELAETARRLGAPAHGQAVGRAFASVVAGSVDRTLGRLRNR
jgi:GMP synthase (glutamine-hydrolysing)